MENFLVSVRAVFPLFAIMSIGYLVRYKNMVDDYSLKKMNNICFKVCMAALMFQNVYTLNFEQDLQPKLLIFTGCSLAFVIITTIVLVLRLEPENRKRGVMIQAIFRSNFVVLGLPIISAVFGDDALGIPTTLICIVVPFYNVFAVVILSYFGSNHPSFKRLAKEVALNPYILAAAFALVFLLLDIHIPDLIYGVVEDLAAVATPLALIILGASFTFGNFHTYLKELIFCCSLRLVIFPAIVMGIAIVLGFRGVELLSLTAIFATPTAIASHAMAQQLGGDADLAGAAVVATTSLALITLFLWIFTLKSFGLLV